MARKKFNNIENPALAYISTKEPEEQEEATTPAEEETGNPPKGYKLNPKYIETKTKRVQLVLKPSMVDEVKKVAKSKKQSINSTIEEAIEEYLKRQ